MSGVTVTSLHAHTLTLHTHICKQNNVHTNVYKIANLHNCTKSNKLVSYISCLYAEQ